MRSVGWGANATVADPLIRLLDGRMNVGLKPDLQGFGSRIDVGRPLVCHHGGVLLHRNGFHIDLPNTRLYIAHGCSGIRYLLSYLVFGLAYACIFKKSFKARVLVVMGALPLSIVGGVLRLWIIFFSAYYIGPIMVEHRSHVLLSWSVFTLLLVGVIFVDQYVLRRRGS